MANDRDTAIQRTARKIKDIGSGLDGSINVELTSVEIGEEVDAAVIQYSTDFPYLAVKDVVTSANPFISHATLPGWVLGWSHVRSIEPNAGSVSASYSPQSALDLSDIAIDEDYFDGTTHYVYLNGYTPGSSETVRIRYTVPHTLDNTTDTIPSSHFDAVCDLAAAYCCTRLGTKAAKARDATISADGVAYRDAQLRYRQQGDEFTAQYRRKVGLPASGPKAASGYTDWDVGLSWRRDRLTHPGRWR